MGFFAKKVYDEDLCFVRDLIEMGSAVASVTSVPVMQRVINDIINRNNLQAKLQEFANNQNYNVQDSYPADRQKRFTRAGELLSISKQIGLSTEQGAPIIYRALTLVKNMGFSYDEKVRLIKTYLIDCSGNSQIDDFLIEPYIGLL